MNIEEAIEYLKENLKNWKDTRPNLSNTDIVEEIDKDYKAIETLLTAYEKEKALAKNHKIAFEKQTENLHEVEALYEKEKEKNKEHKQRITFLENKIFNQKQTIKEGGIKQ